MKKLKKSFKDDWQLYVLFLPTMIYVFIFSYMPIYGLQIAFQKFTPSRGFADSPWVGFDNFIKFFNAYNFETIIGNTLTLSFYALIAGFLPPIILAILLNNVKNVKFKGFVQTVTYAPHFISVVVLVSMIILLLSPYSGVVNSVIAMFGNEKIDFMGSPELFPHVYVWSNVWQTMGFSSIIYLATLVSISPDLYEAAKVDGANKFQQILHIEIPGLIPTAVTMLILACGRVMNLGMQKVYLMQNPMNIATSEIIETFVYKQGILSQQYSYSAAVGLFQSLINVVLIVSVNKIASKISENSLW